MNPSEANVVMAPQPSATPRTTPANTSLKKCMPRTTRDTAMLTAKIGGDLGKLDFRAQLASIKAPFLVLAGRHDGVVLPRLSMRFKKYAPQARFVMFERSGHYPFIEEAPLFLKTMEDFLK